MANPRVGATVHHAFEKLPEIWPTAKYIFLRRDPRDVARSCVQMGWSGTPWRGFNVWLSAEKSWQALQQIITKDQFIAVSFEELMADTPARLSEICDFLGVQYEPGMLSIDEDAIDIEGDGIGAELPRVSLHDFCPALNGSLRRLAVSGVGTEPL